jgi:hypothetical protein
MNVVDKLRARGTLPLVAGLGACAVLGAAALAVVYVSADRLDIVEKKRSVAKVVTTVDRNAPLTVLAKEGPWYKVEVGGKQGYAYETAVSAQPGAKSKGIALSKVKPGRVEQLEQAAAIRGLGEGARQYANANGLRTSGVEELIRRREAITPADFDQFTAAGGLARAPEQASGGSEPAVASSK